MLWKRPGALISPWLLFVGTVLMTPASSPAQTNDVPSDATASSEEASAGETPAETSPEPEKGGWSGPKFTSRDGDVELGFKGRAQLDITRGDVDDDFATSFGDIDDDEDFRRLRLAFSAAFANAAVGKVKLKVDYDLKDGLDDAEAKDISVELTDTPIGGLTIGHFKEPFRLEEVTSSLYTTFVERSLPNVFAPSRNVGILAHDHHLDRRLTWAAGIFRESDELDFVGSSARRNVTARITGLPIYRADDRLVHLGLSLSRKNLDGESFRLRQRPEHRNVARVVDTGSFAADSALLWSLEAATVAGPFWASLELDGAKIDAPLSGDPSFSGASAQAGYFLTGQRRGYDRKAGRFTRVNGELGRFGGVEIAVRYSTIDLEDGAIQGGEADATTLGINWYLRRQFRLVFNFVRTDVESLGNDLGEADAFVTRFQLNF